MPLPTSAPSPFALLPPAPELTLAIGGEPLVLPLAPRAFTESAWLTADFFNPHPVLLQLRLEFVAGDTCRVGEIIFGLYPQVAARLRAPATALALNAWLLPREGALLKPRCGGDRVRPDEVTALRLRLLAGPEGPVAFSATPFSIVPTAPEKLSRAASPHPALLDALGQSAVADWPTKTRDLDTLAVPMVFRDFPDVHHADFPAACAVWAEQLRPTRDDPAATFARVASGAWPALPTAPGFLDDARDFSALMVARLFDSVAAACRAVDPHHLNLGARFAHTPADWMLAGLGSFDVFSINSYSKLARPACGDLSAKLRKPVLIGEWHFGATDTGFPAAALESVATQADRALAYRRNLGAHAAAPWCVGAHWFTLYDQSALGRFDGEPYNCGFLDVCQREQTEIADAARASHEILYALAAGEMPPTELPTPRHVRRLSL